MAVSAIVQKTFMVTVHGMGGIYDNHPALTALGFHGAQVLKGRYTVPIRHYHVHQHHIEWGSNLWLAWFQFRSSSVLFENHGLVAVEQYAVLTMPLHGAGQHLAFSVTPLNGQVVDCFAVVNAGHILFNDGAFV